MPHLRPYAGRWVALVAGRVAGSGRTPAEARQMAQRNRPKERPQVAFVEPKGHQLTGLTLSPLLRKLAPLFSARPPVYLVGGAVRDALLGRASHDLDFATGGDALQLARSVANTLQGAFYVMDAKRGTARVILGDTELDFARFRGGDLLDDLRERDFTINAMALPVGAPNAGAIIDPLGGQNDLAAGLIRATGPAAIHQDPIRGLRAVRQAAQLGFSILPHTRALVRAAAGQLPSVSTERIRDEFMRLLAAPHPAESLRRLDSLDLLPHVLPELVAAKGVVQSPPHTTDVFEHSLLVVEALESLLAPHMYEAKAKPQIFCSQRLWQPTSRSRGPAGVTDPFRARNLGGKAFSLIRMGGAPLSPYASRLATHLARPSAGPRNGRMLLFLAALLHDVGKPETRSVDKDGRIRFYAHEQVGAALAGRRAKRLALSTDEVRQVHTLVRHHMRPAWLSKSSSAARLSRRAIYRFFRDVGENGLDICLLCLADALGKGAPPDPEEWDRRVRTVTTLLEHYFNHYHETISPPPLLDGRELMAALNLSPGPTVGQLLRLIKEAQAAGQINTLDGALALARQAYTSLPQA